MKRKPQPIADFPDLRSVEHKAMCAMAREELDRWKPEFRGTAMIVLFCFIHRWNTGEDVSVTFNGKRDELDWQI